MWAKEAVAERKTYPLKRTLNNGSYMSDHVLLNVLNELGQDIKCKACRAFYHIFAKSLMDSIKQKLEC